MMLPKPTPPQLAWQKAELGVVFHYDLHVFEKKHYKQDYNRRHAIENVNIFNPSQLDTDQWLQVAKDMGARFAILTASHETGFRLWQSDANPYCLKAVKWGEGKRDIVAEFIASCNRYDIKPCIYMGTRWNSQLGLWDFKTTERSPISQAEYNAMIEKEVEEICSRYGPLFELWFDGGAHGPEQGGPDVQSIFEKYQPDCLFYHNLERADARWGGSESGTVPYPCWATFPFHCTGAGESSRAAIEKDKFALLKHGDPNGSYWVPAMSDAPLRNHEWFWDKGDEEKLYSLKSLINMYYKSVGHNSTLIMGLTPDNHGLIPKADAKRCKEWGDAIRRKFSNCVGHTCGENRNVELELDKPTTLDHIVLQEDIREGERVRAYVVESKMGHTWSKLAEGTCIGHKRIHQLEIPITAEKIRLKIEKSTAKATISMAVYLADDTTVSAKQGLGVDS
jgi:alpha-L-fucosidase